MGLSLVRRHCTALLIVAGIAGSYAPLAHAADAPEAQASTTGVPTILVVGDSLSAEYGLQRGTGWVALMAQRLDKEKMTANVVNASISGDTTSGGRSRLPSLLAKHRPAVVVIELGGNDALRGLPLTMTEANLNAMALTAQGSGAKVLIVGMQVPPNYGQDYTKRFAQVFASVAKAHKAALVPFLLKGVADGPDAAKLFQADRIHPIAAAHPTILNTMWPAVRALLK
ncbi:MAG: arylesterase [Rhodoferax sp.]|nr:arylesterase [Rhodoferax sp.]